MTLLHGLLETPTSGDFDLDDPRTTMRRRQIIRGKKFLNAVYREWYAAIAHALPAGREPVLELGSGAGFLAECIDNVITSDVLAVSGVDVRLDAGWLPFQTKSLRGLVMTNVFHHLPDVRAFLREAARVVKPGGLVVMIEPWNTPWSRFVYRTVNLEPFEPHAPDWRIHGGPLSGANLALPWIVFARDRARFEREFPEWRVESIATTMPLRYVMSGGIAMRSLMPGWSFGLWTALEWALGPLTKRTGLFAKIVLSRAGAQTASSASARQSPAIVTDSRAEHEIAHGRHLAAIDPERAWGWGTTAGRLRAVRRAQLISQGAGLQSGVRALEIGCGTGLFTEHFASTGATIVAVDISEPLIMRARERGLAPKRVQFINGRFEEIDLPHRFDCVIGSSVLHHLELEPSLSRIFDLLEPGGRLSFAEPNMLNPLVALEKKTRVFGRIMHASPDETAFVRWLFARTLASHGFTEIEITPFDWLHPFTPSPFIQPVRAVGAIVERIPLVREFSGCLSFARGGPVATDSVRRVAVWLRAYLVLEFVITNLWTQFAQLRWGILPLLALSCCLELRPEWFVPAAPGAEADAARPLAEIRNRLFPDRPAMAAVALGLAICVPVFLHILLTLHEEFPFAGDEGYEVSASRSFALLLKDALPWLVAVAAVAFVMVHRVTKTFTATMILGALFVISFRFQPNEAVARYPGTFYFLATPLNVLAEVLRWKRAFFANHIMNALSVPAWLFLLRPILLRRWPDLAILPLAVTLFFQKEVVYVFGGGQAIEPWAFVLLLLAFEALVVLPDRATWFAYLLVGCSFMTKEPGVFLFPLVWIVAVARTGRARLIQHLACGAVVLAPFVVYYVVRRHAEVLRQVSFNEIGSAFTVERLSIWGHRVLGQFGVVGIAVPIAISMYAVAGFWLVRDRRLRQVHGALTLGTIGLLTLYFTEDQVLPWIAYSRYMLYPLFLLSLILVPLSTTLLQQNRRATVVAIAAVVFVLQVGPLARNLALDLRPEYARNSLEWARVPIYYPVRALLEPMMARPAGQSVRTVRIITPGVDPIIAPVVYPDFRRRLSIQPESWNSPKESCECAPGQAVFIGFQFRTGMALEEPRDVSLDNAMKVCLQRLHVTCDQVLQHFHETGDLVGALGVPRG